jgi:hypothetical protein
MKTIEEIYEIENDIYLTIEKFQSQLPSYPKKPLMPKLATTTPTKEEYENYVQKTNEYNISLEEYHKETKEYNRISKIINESLEYFLADITGLNNIPDEYQTKVWSLAWQKGHSEGWYSVYGHLEELVDLFL